LVGYDREDVHHKVWAIGPEKGLGNPNKRGGGGVTMGLLKNIEVLTERLGKAELLYMELYDKILLAEADLKEIAERLDGVPIRRRRKR